MNRFSVIYTLKEQYHHIVCSTHEEAISVLQNVPSNPKRTPVGIYDAKTELFEWETSRQNTYEQADFEEQGKLANQIISVAQALRRRDASWQPALENRRPTFFA